MAARKPEVLPKIRAALFAHDVLQEEGLWTLRQIVDEFEHPGQPFESPDLWFYLCLGRVIPGRSFEIDVEIVDPLGEDIVVAGTLHVPGDEVRSPLSFTASVPLGSLYLDATGNYDVRLGFNGQVLDVTTIRVR